MLKRFEPKVNARMYCHACNDFRLINNGGDRTKLGWICNTCFKQNKIKRKGNVRDK